MVFQDRFCFTLHVQWARQEHRSHLLNRIQRHATNWSLCVKISTEKQKQIIPRMNTYMYTERYLEGKITSNLFQETVTMYSSPSLIRPPYLPRNCGHIREVAFGERLRSKYIDSSYLQRFVALLVSERYQSLTAHQHQKGHTVPKQV